MMIRHAASSRAEFRAVKGAPEGTIEAIVSVFNTDIPEFRERVRPGAFVRSLERRTPKGVIGHDWNRPVAKTVEIRELAPGDELLPVEIRDRGGLYVKGQINLDTQDGRDLYSNIRFGLVDEFSIGFIVTRDAVASDGWRDIVEADLIEWSFVLAGANPDTKMVSVRSAAGAMRTAERLAPETRGIMLGENIPEQLSMSALMALNDRLFYGAIWRALYSTEIPVELRVAEISAAILEFHDYAVRVVTALLNGTEEQQLDAAEAIAEHIGTEEEITEAAASVEHCLSLRAEQRMNFQVDAVLAAAEALTERLVRHSKLRLHAGRKIAQAIRDRLSRVVESFSSGIDDIKDILKSTEPSTDGAQEQTSSSSSEHVAGDSTIEGSVTDESGTERSLDGSPEAGSPALPSTDELRMQSMRLQARVRSLKTEA